MATHDDRSAVHALRFDDPNRALAAVRRLREDGYSVRDVYSPFPLHGMDAALGLRESRLPLATLAGGVLGGCIAFFFQSWAHTTSWPLEIGGKPLFAWPAFIPVTFELTVLFAAFATVGGLVVMSRLGFRKTAVHPRVTDDQFVVLVEERDATFSAPEFRRLVDELEPVELVERWRVS